MAHELMTVPEVSQMLRIPVATLRDWRHRNKPGPQSFKLCGRVVYKRSDVERWVETQYAKAVGEEIGA